MKAFLEPIGIYSRAMTRIADALFETLPHHMRQTSNRKSADLIVMYVISADAIAEGARLRAAGIKYAVVQCCFETAGGTIPAWQKFWREAESVWSYYALPCDVPYFYAPLGLSSAFLSAPRPEKRTITAMTTGYVHGPGAEAIEEVWAALAIVGGRGLHLGPSNIEGMKRPDHWESVQGVTDKALAHLYASTKYVVALRHVEGFELPAAEGLACGARPVVFDQPAMTHWYEDKAIYLDEKVSRTQLVENLVGIFQTEHELPVALAEEKWAHRKFNWQDLATEFWNRILTPHGVIAAQEGRS